MNLDDKLSQMAKDFWTLVEKSVEVFKVNKEVKFQKRNFELFEKSYIEQYKFILNNYMKDKKGSLDRHKVAAIIIIAVIEAKVLREKESNDKFTGNYAVAVDVALNYLLDEVNELLKENNEAQIEGFVFPKATNCTTDYYRIFYRNLYYIDTNPDWSLNALDIADRLFLLEYITLLQKGIDPKILTWKKSLHS